MVDIPLNLSKINQIKISIVTLKTQLEKIAQNNLR